MPNGDERVTVLLTRLNRVVFRMTDESSLGMRWKAFSLLAHLAYHSGIPQQELGEVLCIDANNLVILLNEVESAGHALRRRDPTDRRRHLVEITPAGQAALAQAEDAIAAVEDDVLSTLSGEERRTLQKLLAKAVEGAAVVAS